MSDPSRPATMADVARAAGVSLQTVSRAFNPGSVIKPATRERVVATAAQLGFRRNHAARSLVTRRTGQVGVIASAVEHFGPASTIMGITTAAQAADYSVVLAALSDTDADSVLAATDRLSAQGVEAILVINRHTMARASAGRHLDPVPIVAVAADPGTAEHCVSIDQRAGARLAARHLLDRGHRRIALVAGPADWLEAGQRLLGWRDELAPARLSPAATWTGDWTAESGYAIGVELSARTDISAVLVANDQMALGLMSALHAAGRRIPGDVAVVGFDNRPDSAFYLPPLTTVEQDLAALGAQAVEVVRHLLDDQPAPTSLVLQPRLVVRSSS